MAGRTNKEKRSWLRRNRADLSLLIAAIVVVCFAIWVILGSGGSADASRSAEPAAAATSVATPKATTTASEAPSKRPVAVFIGRNDAANTGAAAVNILQIFYRIRTKLPNAKIIAISPFWGSGRYPASLRTIGSHVREAVQSVRGQYVDIGSPLQSKSNQLGRYGIYPTAAGQETLAAAVGFKLRFK